MLAVANPRVVIVGGGFGGLACAKKLDGKPVDVLLVDSHNYHLFTPLLYQVATALLNEPDIAAPFRSIFRKSGNVRFLQAHVTGVDFDRKRALTKAGGELAYDYLVQSNGGVRLVIGLNIRYLRSKRATMSVWRPVHTIDGLDCKEVLFKVALYNLL